MSSEDPAIQNQPHFSEIQNELSAETRRVIYNYIERHVGKFEIICTPTSASEVYEELQNPTNKYFTLVEVKLTTDQKARLREALPSILENCSNASFVNLLETYCDDPISETFKFLLVAKHSTQGKGKSEREGYHKLARASISTLCCILPKDLTTLTGLDVDKDLVITLYERGARPVHSLDLLFEPTSGIFSGLMAELVKCHNRNYLLGDPWLGNIIFKVLHNQPRIYFLDLEDFSEVDGVTEDNLVEEFRVVFRYLFGSLRTQENKENAKQVIRSVYIPSLAVPGIDKARLQTKLDEVLDFAFAEYDD